MVSPVAGFSTAIASPEPFCAVAARCSTVAMLLSPRSLAKESLRATGRLASSRCPVVHRAHDLVGRVLADVVARAFEQHRLVVGHHRLPALALAVTEGLVRGRPDDQRRAP